MLLSEAPTFAPMDFLVNIINWFNANPIFIWLFSMLSSLFIIRFWRVCLSPYCYFKNDKGLSFYLGRFVSQEKDPDLPNYWRLMFKHNKITVVRSKHSFTELREYHYLSFGFLKYFSDIVYRETELGDTLKFPKKVFVNTWQNKAKYGFYRFISFVVPSTGLSKKLYNSIEYKDEKARDGSIVYVDKIETLQHQLLFDKIRVIADVKYCKEKIDNVKGKGFEEVKEEAINLYEIEDIRKDKAVKPDSVELTNIKIDIIPTKDLEDALMKQDHIDNIKSLMDIKVSNIIKEYITLDKKYNETREKLSEFHRTFNSELGNVAQRIAEQSELTPERIADIISITYRGKKEGKDIRSIIADIVLHKDDNYNKLVEVNQVLAVENSMLKKKLAENNGGIAGGLNNIRVIKDDFRK